MSAVLSLRRDAPGWRQGMAVLLAGLLAVGLAYFDTMESMVQVWERSATFAHAFLVLPIALWLVWRQRDRVARVTPQPAPRWLLPMAACAVVWLLGDLAKVNALAQFAAVGMLVLSVPLLLGAGVASLIAFPLAFLFFMVPFGEFLLPTLMLWTADVTVMALRVLGVPVYRDGLQFVIPTGTWSVVEACSGARYLIASFMVGSLFAYLNYRSTRRRVLFSLVALVVPVVANWMRAIMIVMLGHLTNNRLAAGVDHLVYGWVFFGIVVMLMFWIGSFWSEPELAAAASRPSGVPAGHEATLPWRPLALVCLGMAVVLGLPRAVAWQAQHATAALPALTLPPLRGHADAATPLDYSPVFVDPTAQATRSYAAGGQVFGVHVAVYRHQDYSRKLVSSANALVKPGDTEWHRVRGGVRRIDGASGAVDVRDAELRFGHVDSTQARRLLVRQVLWVDGRFTARDIVAVGQGVLAQLAGHGDDAAALTFFVEAADPEAADRALDAFVSQHLGDLGAWLQTLRRAP